MRKLMCNTGFIACAAAFALWLAPFSVQAAPVLPQGLSADGQSLEGKTLEEAEEMLQAHADSMAGQTVTLEGDGRDVETTAEVLGLSWKNRDEIRTAAGQYAGGSLVKQYMNRKDLAETPLDLSLETEMDSEKVRGFVSAQCQDVDAAPQDALIVRSEGAFVITPEVVGKAVDVDATLAALNDALAQGLEEPVRAQAVISQQQPRITAEALSTIQDLLGTCTTDFSSSGAARSTNLNVGAEKMNGHLLMPGDVLSGYECLQPFTAANGYKAASAYENGKVVDSIGGGVCQISTTLYDAALYAELEIVQRQNHSMIVGYVKPSMDAAIAGTVKDLKVKNNYDTPIYVEAYTKGKQLTFNIYGQDTRPENRRAEYISETIKTTDPGEPQIIVDPALAPGSRVKVQSSHTGLQSRLWKVVTVDGQEQERTLVSKDTYNASKAIYRVGPEAPAVPETPPTEQEAAPAGPAEGIDGGPGVMIDPLPQPGGEAA